MKKHFIWVSNECSKHESTNWDTIFTSPAGEGTAILRDHLNHAKV